MWRLGWLLQTLSYRIHCELQDSIYKNRNFAKNKWNFIERQLLVWSSAPAFYVALIVILQIALSANIILFAPLFKLFPEQSEGWVLLIDWQSIFLAGQLTIVGVIFPITIGLISLMLEQKAAANIIWDIFYRYSGIIFITFSGILLAILIVISIYVRPIVPEYWQVALAVTSGYWFTFNILLTCWFFWSTSQIVREKSREKLLHRFTANESYIVDIKKKLSDLIPLNVFDMGILKKPSNEVAIVSTFEYPTDGYSKLSVILPHESKVTNIRFRLIGVALCIWLRFFKAESGETPSIVFPVAGVNYRKSVDLVLYKNIKLPWLVKVFILSSYSFTKIEDSIESEVEDALAALIGNAEDALKEDNERRFSRAVSGLKKWTASTVDLLAYSNDLGEPDNWVLLQTDRFFGRTYLDEILREYYLLANQTVNKIPFSTEFYSTVCHFHQGIFSRIESECPDKLGRDLVQASYHNWTALMRWSGFNEKPEGSAIRHQYVSALKRFVGAWESWSYQIGRHKESQTGPKNSLIMATSHLRFTSQMIVSAIRSGDFNAADWAVDMTNRWLSNVLISQNELNAYRWNIDLLTPWDVQEHREEDFWRVIFGEDDFNLRSAINLSLSNAWIDIRITAACYLLSRSVEDVPEDINRLVAALVEGLPLQGQTSIRSRGGRSQGGAEVLTSFIRQRGYWIDGKHSYTGWINATLDAFNSIEEPEHVSGRIYTMGGAREIRSLLDSFVELAVRQSSKKWGLNHRLQENLISGTLNEHQMKLLIDDLDLWKRRLEEHYIAHLNDGEERKAYAENCLESIRGIQLILSDQMRQNILDADIDPKKLEDIAVSLSGKAFSEDSAEFPIFIFRSIVFDCPQEEQYRKRVNITKFQKSHVAANVEVNRPINESEWFEDLMDRQNQAGVLSDIVQHVYADRMQEESESVEDLLSRIISDGKKMEKDGFTPLILLSSFDATDYLNRASYEESISEKFSVTRKEGFGSSYICHLNGIEVYDLAGTGILENIVVAAEMFNSIHYASIAPEMYVEVNFLQNLDEKMLGTLQIDFWRQVVFDDAPAYIYKYSSAQDS